MVRKPLLLFVFCLCSVATLYGQICDNINGEQGDYTNWSLFTGSFVNPYQNVGLDPISHRIFSGTMQDPNIPALQVPVIGNHSFILGNDGEGSETDKMSYTLDVTAENYLVTINYLPVFTQELEPEVKAAKFSIQIANGNQSVSECLIDSFFADLSSPFYAQYEIGDDKFLYARNWQVASLSLEDYIGQSVDLLLSADECFFSNHYTYVYLDIRCTMPQFSVYGCNSEYILKAPSGFLNYLWSNSDMGQQISISSLDELTGLSVVVSNGTSCNYTISDFEIIGQELFDFQIIDDSGTISCQRNPVSFNYNVKPTIPLHNLTWDFGDGSTSQETNPIHTFPFGGEYEVQVSFTTDIGCSYTFSQTINASGPIEPNIQLPATNYCSNEGLIDLPFSSNGKFTGDAISNGDFDPALVVGDSSLVSYHFVDLNGCSDTLWFYMYHRDVTVNPIEDITLVNQNETQVEIHANGGLLNYLWSPITGLSCIDCPNPIIMVEDPIRYTSTVINEYGCRDSISFNIETIGNGVFIPNAFSPNNDGRNDVFYPRGAPIEKVLQINVYNRYGALVFKRGQSAPNEAGLGWDGTYKNQLLNSGVFIYEISVQLLNGEIYYQTGSVVLIR